VKVQIEIWRQLKAAISGKVKLKLRWGEVMETIEQKLLRLNSARTGMADNRNEGYFSFLVVCELLEMAIAEEREANAKICDDLHDRWRFGDDEDSIWR